MKLIGHRGSVSIYPENTLKAIQHSFELGCYGVEIDVRKTKDGKLVLMHDAKEIEIDECIVLGIPTLEMVIDCMKKFNEERYFELFIEIKEIEIWKDVMDSIEEDIHQFIVIKSLIPEVINNVKNYLPGIRIGIIIYESNYDKQIFDNFIPIIDILSIDYNFLNEDMINITKRFDKKLFVWTVNEKEIYKTLEKIEIDYLCTDLPEYFV